jgi:hypothetical protein
MKKPLNHSILIVIGAVIMVMVVYVYIVGQFTGGPLDSSSAGRTGRTLQQLQSPGAEQPSNEQPSGAGQLRRTRQMQRTRPARRFRQRRKPGSLRRLRLRR